MRSGERDAIILLSGLLLGAVFYHFAFPLFFPPVLAVFSPGAEDDVVAFIDSARQSIDVEMYVFSSEEMVDALQRAHDRGVRVRVILERRTLSASNEETFAELRAHGIAVRWASDRYKLTHSKFVIVDGQRVLVGSHNWSDSALESNREASVILSSSVVGEFRRAFEWDWNLAA